MKIYGAVLERMNEARSYETSAPTSVQSLELDAPGPGELLVRIEIAGVCHSDLSIVARTDAVGPLGLDEAMKRARRFGDAGADILFIDAPQSHEQLTTIGKSLKGPLMVNMSEGGLTPAMSAPEFHALGFGIVAFPTAALRVAAKSIEHLDIDKNTL